MSNNQMITKAVRIFSTRGQTAYQPGDVITIKVNPNQVQLINPYNTYLKFSFLTSGNARLTPDERAGGLSCIKNITIKDGTGQNILEQITEYATLKGVKDYVEKNDSLDNLKQLLEGKTAHGHQERNYPVGYNLGAGCVSQYWTTELDNTATMTSNGQKRVEVILSFSLSGLLGKKDVKLLPVVLLRGLQIEVELESDVNKVLMYNGIKNTNGEIIGYGNPNDPNPATAAAQAFFYRGAYVGGAYTGNGIAIPIGAVNVSSVLLCNRTNDAGGIAAPNNPLENGFVNSPFCIGQSFRVNANADGTGVSQTFGPITSISVDTTSGGANAGRIRLHFANQNNTSGAVLPGNVIIDTTTGITAGYSVENVEFIASSVQAPQGYLASMSKALNGKGITMSYKTYRNYPINVNAGNLQSSLYIPSKLSRALSIVSVPSSQVASALQNENLKPERGAVSSYQFLISGILTPSQSVSLSKTAAGRWDALAVMENVSAWENQEWVVRNVEDIAQNNFTISRNFSRHNHTYNLGVKGELRLNVNYTSLPAGLIYNNFISHYKAVQISNQGVVVLE